MKKYVEVDREPVVGDMVKIVDLRMSDNTYKMDDVLEVVGFHACGSKIGVYVKTEKTHACNMGRNTSYIDKSEFVVVEESTEFTKSDLKPCMVVKLRNGELYIVSDSKLGLCINDFDGEYMRLSDYNNEMLCTNGLPNDRNYDIIKIYDIRNDFQKANKFSTDGRELLYSRTEPSARDIKIKELQSKMDAIKREMEELK